jgi:hypothetical protein
MPKEAVGPPLAALLKTRDAGLRRSVAWILDALDADELVVEVGELLGDDHASLARVGVRTVRRRALRDRMDEVERLSASSDPPLKREALATLVELDWAGRRAKLFGRLKAGEAGLLPDAAPLFAAKGDGEALRFVLDEAAKGGKEGYEALTALNGWRNPTATLRAVELKYSGIGTVRGATPLAKAKLLAEEVGPIRLEGVPEPPGPRVQFPKGFGAESDGSGEGAMSRAMSGGFWKGGGRWSTLDKIRTGLGDDLVPIVEDDVIRLLPHASAVAFWRAWAAERK